MDELDPERLDKMKELGDLIKTCDDLRGVMNNLIYTASLWLDENTAQSFLAQLKVHQPDQEAEEELRRKRHRGTEFAQTCESEDDAFWRNDHARSENDY